MIVYLDVILIENLFMNYIILFSTGLINKSQISIIRLILSSILGSTYAVISYIMSSSNLSSILFKIIFSIAMVYLAFKPRNVKVLFRYLVIFYLTSFAFGGCAFFLLYFIRPQDILIKNGVLVGTYPIKIAALGGILGFIIINIAFSVVKGKISKKDMFCEVEIFLLGKIIQTKAMIDTGNLLKEPITGIPVVIIEKDVLVELIPKEILDNMKQILEGNVIGEDNLGEYSIRLRVIPFTSLGKENGMLLGIKTDKIVINFRDDNYVVYDVIIGIYDKYLSKQGKYKALIGLDILQNSTKSFNRKLGDENEFISSTKI